MDSICFKESARQLRLRILLLEDENDDLHYQLAEEDDRVDVLEKSTEELREKVVVLESDAKRTQTSLRLKMREAENMQVSGLEFSRFWQIVGTDRVIQVEMASLNGVSTTSTKLLTEKLSLTRELANLKPELEHLRSQSQSNQGLLAEKLSLERQLGTLQVELETEKRATKRMQAKGGRSKAEDSKLEEELGEVQMELAREKTERQKLETDSMKQAADWDNRKTILEGRVEALKTKLRSTKEQLKETRSDLQRAQLDAAHITRKDDAERPDRNARKRKAVQLYEDDAIGTPDGFAGMKRGPAANKSNRPSTMPGDKSTFSITPFLNRTASIAPESPAPQSDIGQDIDAALEVLKEVAELEPIESSGTPSKTRVTKKAAQVPKVKEPSALTSTAPNKTNARSRKTQSSALESVAEEEGNEENEQPAVQKIQETAKDTSTGPSKTQTSQQATTVEPKKKKRKLLGSGLGKTLFDDDDAEIAKASENLLGGGKGLADLGKAGLGAPKSRVIGTSAGGFGQFSPRKKDKKAMSRSILQ